MQNNQENNSFIEQFKTNFESFKYKRIVLYGIGIKTESVTKNVPYNFIGLMDKEPANMGKSVYGLKILDEEQVIKNAELIIIVSSNIYFQTIFSRIESLKNINKIPIYFCDGTIAKSFESDKNIENNKYWEKSLTHLKKEIDKHEVISFDVFDTLLTRKVTEPIDLLHIIQRELSLEDFVEKRIKSEIKLGKKAKLTDIYNNLPEEYKKGLEREEELEFKLNTPRKDIVEVLNYAKEQKKEIYLITDIYHTKIFMQKLLDSLQIIGYKDILVSCDLEKRKSDNSLWEHFKSLIKSKKTLHIGDNLVSDIQNAKKININTYHIYSPYEILKNSTLKNIVPKICTLDHSLIIGQFISKIFNSPFSLNKSKGKLHIHSFYKIGYIFYGAILFNYIVWITKKNIKNKHDLTLFVARDGYFLEKLYNLVKEKYTISSPKSEYLMISRNLITIVNIKNKKDIKNSLLIKFEGLMSDYFLIRFGIQINNNKYISTQSDKKEILEIVEQNEQKIIKNASNQRYLYLKYLKRILKNKKNISIIDPSYKGTIQFNLSKFLDIKCNGYYCNADLSKDNVYYKNNMFALFQEKDDQKAENSKLRKNTIFFEEGILVSPEGTCLNINKDLSFNFSTHGFTQKNFKNKEEIFSGIIDFFDDILNCYNDFNKIELSPSFIDYFIQEVYSENIEISKSLKDTFFYDSLFEKILEGKIFD